MLAKASSKHTSIGRNRPTNSNRLEDEDNVLVHIKAFAKTTVGDEVS
jgi:hypothetical protein